MPKQRQLTRFLCRELLYDYIEGLLDPERKKAVEEFLGQDQELTYELEAMKRARRYCDNLSSTRLSEERIEQLSLIKPKVNIVLGKLSWRNWPDTLRWSTQALGISVVAMVIGLSFPWDKLGELVELGTHQEELLDLPPFEVAGLATDGIISDEDEGKEALDPKKLDQEQRPTPEPEKAVARAEPEEEADRPEKKEAKPEPKEPEEPALKGMLYRILMTHHQTKKISVDIREKIQSFGGSRAGQVELGWRRENGNYFHFSIPEKHYDELIVFLEEYGSMTIYKNPHERVMPRGIRRIILWIEDRPKGRPNEENEEDEAESPNASSANAGEE